MKNLIKLISKKNPDNKQNIASPIGVNQTSSYNEDINNLSRNSSVTLFSITSGNSEFHEYFENNEDSDDNNQLTKLTSRTKIKNFLTKIISNKNFNFMGNSTPEAHSLDSLYDMGDFEYLPFYF